MPGLYNVPQKVVSKATEMVVLAGAGAIDGMVGGIEKSIPTIKTGPSARFVKWLGASLGDEKPASVASPAEKK